MAFHRRFASLTSDGRWLWAVAHDGSAWFMPVDGKRWAEVVRLPIATWGDAAAVEEEKSYHAAMAAKEDRHVP